MAIGTHIGSALVKRQPDFASHFELHPRMVSVKVEKPRYHATEDGRWDFRVTITFKSAAVAFAPFDEAALARQLYPDQETFKKEEARRFEILLSHWDVPIVPVE